MKILATDYDGTLNHGGIDKEKCDAIKKWQENGNLFGIVSGRSLEGLKMLISGKENPKNLVKTGKTQSYSCDFLIANNGAVICDGKMNVLTQTKCKTDIIEPLIKVLFDLNCPLACVCGSTFDDTYIKPDKEHCETDEFTLENMPSFPFFNQISTILDTDEEAFEVAKVLRERFSDRLNPLQNGRCIDIVPKGVDKASGIYALLDAIGAKKEDVITVGDNINDADMIREFYSYAMENGVDAIKQLADKTTVSVTELIKNEL
ncbi:MAG: HAD-IIB family hydrolase [Clostridia bacterium]|nr:HAD-IIB family hydrolase [Clostridia bacterium]